jgi:hypothetical protein
MCSLFGSRRRQRGHPETAFGSEDVRIDFAGILGETLQGALTEAR